MKNVTSNFLNSLPVMHATLQSWEVTPPFPLLLAGDESAAPRSRAERLKHIEAAAELVRWGTVHFDHLVFTAIEAFAIYRSQANAGVAEDDPIFIATAQVTFQLGLNARDSIQNLEIHAGHTPKEDFHLAAQINIYDEHEATTTGIS